jgi:hypothetical protein
VPVKSSILHCRPIQYLKLTTLNPDRNYNEWKEFINSADHNNVGELKRDIEKKNCRLDNSTVQSVDWVQLQWEKDGLKKSITFQRSSFFFPLIPFTYLFFFAGSRPISNPKAQNSGMYNVYCI